MKVDWPHTSDASARGTVQNDKEEDYLRVAGSEQQVRDWEFVIGRMDVGLANSAGLHLSEQGTSDVWWTEGLVHDLGHSSTGWLEPTPPATQDLHTAATAKSSDTESVSSVASRTIRSYYTAPSKWLGRYRHLRTARINRLLPSLRAIIVSKALQSGLPIFRPVVDVEADPEEGTSQLVMRVYVDASPAQTLAFWDSLDIELDRWLKRLDHNDGQAVLKDIGLRFHWSASRR